MMRAGVIKTAIPIWNYGVENIGRQRIVEESCQKRFIERYDME